VLVAGTTSATNNAFFEERPAMTLADITARFRFVEETLAYVDAPLEGFLVELASGERYAFRCQEVVAKTVWHWVLLPAGEGNTSVDDVFTSAKANPPSRWLSVIEDRRGEKLEVVEMADEKTPPPIEGVAEDAKNRRTTVGFSGPR
jgi:hypothetical protein